MLHLQKSFISGFIILDIPAIISLLSNDKRKLLKTYKINQSKIWSKYFNITKKIFKRKMVSFNHMIKTEEISISIIFEKIINNIPISIKSKRSSYNNIFNETDI